MSALGGKAEMADASNSIRAVEFIVPRFLAAIAARIGSKTEDDPNCCSALGYMRISVEG
jgi:hypothetical protein